MILTGEDFGKQISEGIEWVSSAENILSVIRLVVASQPLTMFCHYPVFASCVTS